MDPFETPPATQSSVDPFGTPPATPARWRMWRMWRMERISFTHRGVGGLRAKRATGAPEARQAERAPAQAEHAGRWWSRGVARGARHWSAEGATGGVSAGGARWFVRQHMMVYDSGNPGMDKQSGAAGWFMTREKNTLSIVEEGRKKRLHAPRAAYGKRRIA